MKKNILLLSFLLFFSCDKNNSIEENTNFYNGKNGVVNNNLITKEDYLKITMSESFSNLFKKDPINATNFIKQNLIKEGKTSEFIYSINKNNKSRSFNSKSLEELLIDNIQLSKERSSSKKNELEEKKNLIMNATSILPNLVVKIPNWFNVVIDDETKIEDLDYKIIPAFSNKALNYEREKNTDDSKSYIPILIKESETLIPIKKGSYETIWNDNLVFDHFPSLKNCSNFIKDNYIVFSDETYEYIDKMKLNKDLLNGVICSINLSTPSYLNRSSCKKQYERDCVREKNVIEGIKFSNAAALKAINNQPEGEDVISLHYTFVSSQMCGDLKKTSDCPPNHWKFVFTGSVEDFFYIQKHKGYPRDSERKDVIYEDHARRFYIKAFPKYFDIPIEHSLSGMYSQAAYLINTPSSTWDGNVYGSVVSFSIHEHDQRTVTTGGTRNITINNSSKVSTKLNIKDVFEVGADFDENVTKNSSYTYSISAEQDVDLGQNACSYYDQNYKKNGKIYGINKSTGTVITHFAFYY